MMERFVINNSVVMNIKTEYQYVSLVSASYYNEEDTGLRILWWKPMCCNGESQLEPEVFPFTVEGLLKASQEARALNNQIRKEVEDNTFTFRR